MYQAVLRPERDDKSPLSRLGEKREFRQQGSERVRRPRKDTGVKLVIFVSFHMTKGFLARQWCSVMLRAHELQVKNPVSSSSPSLHAM